MLRHRPTADDIRSIPKVKAALLAEDDFIVANQSDTQLMDRCEWPRRDSVLCTDSGVLSEAEDAKRPEASERSCSHDFAFAQEADAARSPGALQRRLFHDDDESSRCSRTFASSVQ